MKRRNFFKTAGLTALAAPFVPNIWGGLEDNEDIFTSFKYGEYTVHKRKNDIMDNVPYNFDEGSKSNMTVTFRGPDGNWHYVDQSKWVDDQKLRETIEWEMNNDFRPFNHG